MKKILILFISITFICGCQDSNGKNNQEMELSTIKEINQIEGLSASIKEGTLTKDGATIVITDLSGKDHIFGAPYHLEKFINDKWYVLNPTCSNCGFTLQGLSVDENNKLELDINFKFMYGSLESGKYRIVQHTSDDDDIPITEDELKYYSVEFEIE